MKIAHNSSSSVSDANQFVWISKEVEFKSSPIRQEPTPKVRFAPLQSLRQWLDSIEIHDSESAHLICRSIPAQCPFERTVKLFGRTLFYIPPMCKLNPLYDQFVGLRFRALCYLADVCGEDIAPYC